MCYSMKIAFYQDSINLPLNLVNPEKSPRKSTINRLRLQNLTCWLSPHNILGCFCNTKADSKPVPIAQKQIRAFQYNANKIQYKGE